MKPLHEQKSLGKLAKKGVVWSFLREGVIEIIGFPMSMVLARLLTPHEFGIAAAGGFFALMAGRLSELGFNAALVRSKDLKPIHLSTVFVTNVVMGLVSFALLTSMAPVVAAFYHIEEAGKILSVAAVAFLFAPLGTVPAALLVRNMQFEKSATVDWSSRLSLSIASIVLAWFGFSYMSLMYGKVVGVIVQTALRMTFARWTPSLRFSWDALREILPFGAGVYAKRLLDYTAQYGDNLIVGKVLGMEALGIYDKAFSTMDRFLTRMNEGGPNVTFRIFAIIHEDHERFRKAYQKVVMSTALIGFPVFTVMIAMAPQLMVALFGERWAAAAGPFRFLCVAGMLKLLNSYASSATQAAGRIWSEVWRQLLLISMIGAGILAMQNWGPTGAAAGVLIATGTMGILMHILLNRVTQLRWRDIARPLVPALMCAMGAGVVTLAVGDVVRAVVQAPNAWLLVACQLPMAGLFIATFVLFAPHAEMRALVREVANDLAPAAIKGHRWVQRYLNPPALSASV